MFCFQCQEAHRGVGCSAFGMCGKTDDVANLQDLLMYVVKGISVYSSELRVKGNTDDKTDRFILDSIFMTITNVNFDRDAFISRIQVGLKLRDSLKEIANLENVNEDYSDAAKWNSQDYDAKSLSVGIRKPGNHDIISLKELLSYGIKGVAAYAVHALNLGKTDENIISFIEKGLLATLRNEISADELLGLVMECGKFAVDVLALLDAANTLAYGNPEITKVKTGVNKNPGILITGHDLKDLEQLLKQTEGTGIDVYTHGEMLPGHYYPEFKKYKHLVGHYGGAWWNQTNDFDTFNGPIIFTTNCLVPPMESYIDRCWTSGATGYEGMKYIESDSNEITKNYSAVIEQAKKCEPPKEIENSEILGGFAHNQILKLADKVVEAVKNGDVKKFVVMAGCDGRSPAREYYTDFAKELPADTIILTAGCAKFRYNKLNLGDIGGIPRVLDAGQCNDSYSLAVVALKLKEVFNLEDINDLPIIYNIAWYEQKAVTVLLALLYLGVKNIHLGPSLPSFLSPNVANILVEKFGIAPIKSVEEDMKIFFN